MYDTNSQPDRENTLLCTTPIHSLIVKTLYRVQHQSKTDRETLYHVRHQFTDWSSKRFAVYDSNSQTDCVNALPCTTPIHRPIVKRFTVHYTNSHPDRENALPRATPSHRLRLIVKSFTMYDTNSQPDCENISLCTTPITDRS